MSHSLIFKSRAGVVVWFWFACEAFRSGGRGRGTHGRSWNGIGTIEERCTERRLLHIDKNCL